MCKGDTSGTSGTSGASQEKEKNEATNNTIEENQQEQGIVADVDGTAEEHKKRNDTKDHGSDASVGVTSRPENHMAKASCFSRLFFFWPYPLLKLGLQRPLEELDLPEILPVDTSNSNYNHFERLWAEEIKRNPSRPNLHWAFFKEFIKSTWYVQPLMMIAAIAKIVQAIVLGLLIETFERASVASIDDTDNVQEIQREGYKWAAILVAAGLAILFEHHHVFFATWRKGMQLRVSCVAAIYAKSLRLSSTHQETNASTGKIMNLASNDVERFILAALFMCHLFWSPVQSIAILIVGWLSLGPAFAAGFALLVFGFVPFQFHLSKKFAIFRSKIAAITDRRVTFVSQAVHGARVMKMSGYEWRFLDRIQAIRKEEVDQIDQATRLKAWNETLFYAANIVISMVIFLVHVGTGNTLTPRDVFTVFTLINVLQLEMTKHVALGVMGVSEVYVSITRIQNFLEYPELPSSSSTSTETETNQDDKSNDIALSMSNVTSYWNQVEEVASNKLSRKNITPKRKKQTTNDQTVNDIEDGDGFVDGTDDRTRSDELVQALSDISIDFRKGELTCIIGTVGSGKSALIQAVVGELPVYSGCVSRSNQAGTTLAYAAQDPWIMDGTVKENITMGMDVDQRWYDKVVDACGLRIDFTQFLNGDMTIVGDRGVQCSGGQRARIGLARALYRDADILVVDDPLSAVDAKVGKQLFNEAILGLAVNRGKCVILSTHQHQYVNDHRCVLMVSGTIKTIGTYDECVNAAGGKLTAHSSSTAIDTLAEDGDKDEPKSSSATSTSAAGLNNSVGTEQTVVTTDGEKGKAMTGKDGDADKEGETNDASTQEFQEDRESGLVRMDTFVEYARAMGGVWLVVLLMILFSLTQATALTAIATMGRWAERPSTEQKDLDVLLLVIGLGVSVFVLAAVRALLSFHFTIKASQRLHDRMTKAVLRAKIAFFDTNPLGRVLNRFSADIGSNDDMLPQTLFDFFVIFFIVVGTIVTTIVVLPFALFAMPPLIWYFVSVRKVFVTSSRELKRLEGLARSPIFAMLSESLNGVATIRANNSQRYFTQKFENAHDAHTRAFFSFIASSRWVGFRMDSLMFFLMAIVSFLSVLFQQQQWFTIDPAILGLSISMLLQLAGMFQWCIRQSAECVNLMVSVERVLAFGRIESEAQLELDSDGGLPSDWPDQGRVDVKELSVRYRPSLPLALNQATFTIPSGSRVGVVGRTGSGKSTIVQTLFRLLEAENGSITIDGVDIADVGLHRLRTKFSVIPQLPTLFSGCTVRENLDLFGIHSDEAIQEALDDAHMGEAIQELPNGYDSMVSEGGSNFSVGQRQLLCLARAILSKNKLLILDEATASVDRRTDQMLHESLQKSFSDATIIAVAHRLDTVIEHDYILVLGRGGKVLEFGPPGILLKNDNGTFSKMVHDTGTIMSTDLKRRAFASLEH